MFHLSACVFSIYLLLYLFEFNAYDLKLYKTFIVYLWALDMQSLEWFTVTTLKLAWKIIYNLNLIASSFFKLSVTSNWALIVFTVSFLNFFPTTKYKKLIHKVKGTQSCAVKTMINFYWISLNIEKFKILQRISLKHWKRTKKKIIWPSRKIEPPQNKEAEIFKNECKKKLYDCKIYIWQINYSTEFCLPCVK